HRSARVRLEATMKAADAELAKLGTAKPVGLVLRGSRERRLRRLDEWAHDVGLPALAQEPGEPRVCLGGAALVDPARNDRLAVCGRLRDLGDREIAVHRECKRARDRR